MSTVIDDDLVPCRQCGAEFEHCAIPRVYEGHEDENFRAQRLCNQACADAYFGSFR